MAGPVGASHVALHGLALPCQIVNPYTVAVDSLIGQIHWSLAILGRACNLVGALHYVEQLLLVGANDACAGFDSLYGAHNALLVWLVDVVLQQQTDAVASGCVGLRVAGVVDVDKNALLGSI